MRWGFAHQLGPFELWDALGFEDVCKRLESEHGAKFPKAFRRCAAPARSRCTGLASRVRTRPPNISTWSARDMKRLEDRPGVLSLPDIKRARGVVKQNAGASLVDLGDGVLCVEFHSKMNSIGEDQIGMLHAGLEETAKNFEAMVIANQGENFSVGANLMLVLLAAQGRMGRSQSRDSSLPAGEHGSEIRAEAGSCCALRADRSAAGVRNSAALRARPGIRRNLYGLVEVGVGLIPERRRMQGDVAAPEGSAPRFRTDRHGQSFLGAPTKPASFGFLNKGDHISMNPEGLLGDAKQAALALALVREITRQGFRALISRSARREAASAPCCKLWRLGLCTKAIYQRLRPVVVAEKLANMLRR